MQKKSPEAQQLIEKYKAETDPRELEQEFGLKQGSIPRMMRRWGVERNVKRLTKEQKQQAIEQYQQGISSEIVAKNMGISSSSVCRAVKEAGLQIRPATENKRKYDVNTHYFENIDSEEKAYWLGLLYADAHVSKRGASVSLTQELTHLDIMERFSNTMYGFVKLSSEDVVSELGNANTYYTCSVYSVEMVKDLEKWGCPKQKSFTITFPTFLREDLYQHFIRGFIDGDGHISDPEKDKRHRLCITSNLTFLTGFKNYIEPILGIRIPKFTAKKDRETETRDLTISKHSDLITFLNYLYKDAVIYLQCKKDNYDKINSLFNTKAIKNYDKIHNIEWYGTTYTPSYDDVLLTRDYVKQIPKDERKGLEQYLFDFYREQGFPYFQTSDDELLMDFLALKKADLQKVESEKIINLHNMSGVDLTRQFAPHLMHVKSSRDFTKPTPVEAFQDDFALRRVISLVLNDNDGLINGNKLRQWLTRPKIAYRTSSFSPVVAKWVYTKYCKENDIIYDFSCGFGQRLTGALSMPYRVKYIGVDPSEKSSRSNLDIYHFLQRANPGLKSEAEIVQIGSENYCPSELYGMINLAFSSPPYFDLELYANDTGQACYNRGYISFVNDWWGKVVDNIDKLLAMDATFVLNVGKKVYDFNFAEDMASIVTKSGWYIADKYQLELQKRDGMMLKHEPVFVFKRHGQPLIENPIGNIKEEVNNENEIQEAQPNTINEVQEDDATF